MFEFGEVQYTGEIARNGDVIAAEINAIKANVRASVLAASIEIGKRLCEAKAMLPVGSWISWLEKNVEYSERTAQNLMRCFEEYGKKGIPEGLEKASFTNAVQLLGLPEEMKRNLIDSGKAEELSARELKQEIERLKAEQEKQQATLFELMEERDQAKADAERAADRLQAQEEDLRGAREAAMLANSKAMSADEQRSELERALLEAREKAMEPAVVEKEVIPLEVERELQHLRAQVKETPEEIRFYDALGRLNSEITNCMQLISCVMELHGEKGKALILSLRKILEQAAGIALNMDKGTGR